MFQRCLLNVACVAFAVSLATIIQASPPAPFSDEGNCAAKDSSLRPDSGRAILFFKAFQLAFSENDKETVALLVNYPLRTTLHGKRERIRSKAELLAHYDEIFDRGVRCSILAATGATVWGNWQGFMIGHGDIWFDAIVPPGDKTSLSAPDFWTRYPFKVITVNNDSHLPCATSSQLAP